MAERTELTAKGVTGVRVKANGDMTVTVTFTMSEKNEEGIQDIELTFPTLAAIQLASNLMRACGVTQ